MLRDHLLSGELFSKENPKQINSMKIYDSIELEGHRMCKENKMNEKKTC